ncbi:hypothetical protein, partial [Arenimonas sp. GDDSR-1]|uniref:hypothetical protein n=1 Tax=Arenimonas sp. GDDSR-1 TaxID=2950125 RepID=UPI002624B27A
MTTPQSTHITLILDRSGSMSDITDDIIGGVNRFFDAQRKSDLPATATLVQFDSQDPFEVLAENVTLDKVPPLSQSNYQPRASTPLLDAIGTGIHRLSAHLDMHTPETKPDAVVFVIVTDGMENASTTFTRAHITDLIKAKKDAGWEFVFLSSDLSAVQEAQDFAVHSSRSANFSKRRVAD